MFLDDCAGNNMTLPLSVLVEGELDCPAIESAYIDALQQHPLFCATISKQDHKWHKTEKPEGIIWLNSNSNKFFPWEKQQIDLTKSAGLQLAISKNDNSYIFHFLFHHCTSDGIGYFQFLNTLFQSYRQKINKNNNKNIEIKKYTQTNLHNRLKQKPLINPPKLSLLDTVKLAVFGTGDWLFRKPLAPISNTKTEQNINRLSSLEHAVSDVGISQSFNLCETQIDGETVRFELRNWGDSGLIFVRLSRNLTTRIIAKSKRLKFTLGDILLANIFISLANSKYLLYESTDNNKQKIIQNNDILRIGIVNNMRGENATEIPACNIISYSFSTRSFNKCQNTPEFHAEISNELHFVKNYSIGNMFLNGLAFFARLPFLLRRFVSSRRCLASAILSSMNRIDSLFSAEFPRDDFGRVCVEGLTLVDFYSAAPFRRGTPISVTTNTYAGSLGFFVQYDNKKINQNDAAGWLTEWIDLIVKDE
jgi:hypothetical protein